jgi:hypothetical protein
MVLVSPNWEMLSLPDGVVQKHPIPRMLGANKIVRSYMAALCRKLVEDGRLFGAAVAMRVLNALCLGAEAIPCPSSSTPE